MPGKHTQTNNNAQIFTKEICSLCSFNLYNRETTRKWSFATLKRPPLVLEASLCGFDFPFPLCPSASRFHWLILYILISAVLFSFQFSSPSLFPALPPPIWSSSAQQRVWRSVSCSPCPLPLQEHQKEEDPRRVFEEPTDTPSGW